MRSDLKRGIAALAVLLVCAGALAAPYSWRTPKGWRTEVFALPPSFAPELKLKGAEELRFPPRCFEPGSPHYFSYVYVWWLEREESLTAAELKAALTGYYHGLYNAVGKGRKLPPRDPGAVAEVRAADLPERYADRPGARFFRATIRTYDPFSDGRAVKLNGEILLYPAREGDARRIVAVIAVSPQPAKAEVWKTLRALVGDFKPSAKGLQ